MMKAVLLLLLSVFALVSAQRDSECPNLISSISDVKVYFDGTATESDWTALEAACSGDCFDELDADLDAYLKSLAEDDTTVCGVDLLKTAETLGSLSSFLCLTDGETESQLCVQRVQTAFSDAGIDLNDLTSVQDITLNDICGAAAATGCCFASYTESLVATLKLACATDLAEYAQLLLFGCPLATDYDIPDACEGWEAPEVTVDENKCPTEVDCEEQTTDCESSVCQLLYCIPDVDVVINTDTGEVSDEDVAELVDALLDSLNTANDASQQCTASSYGLAYNTSDDGPAEDNENENENVGGGAAQLTVSLAALIATAALAFRFM